MPYDPNEFFSAERKPKTPEPPPSPASILKRMDRIISELTTIRSILGGATPLSEEAERLLREAGWE